MKSLIINSQFQPFSMDEMLKPVLMADQEHKAIDESLAELGTNAATLEQALDAQREQEAYNLYHNYNKDLKNYAGELASRGLDQSSRRNLLNMKRRYGSDIATVQQAVKRRMELAQIQQDAKLRDSTMFFDTPASAISVDTIMRDPATTFRSYSGNTLMQMSAAAASALSKEMRDDPLKWESILGQQYYQALQRTGFSKEEVLNAIQNNERASKELMNIKESIFEASGIKDWNNKVATDQAMEHINAGLWNAVGTGKWDRLQNQTFDSTGSGAGYNLPPLPFTRVPKTSKGEGSYSEYDKDLKALEALMAGEVEEGDFYEGGESYSDGLFSLKEPTEFRSYKGQMVVPSPVYPTVVDLGPRTYKAKVNDLLKKHDLKEDTPENRQKLREQLARKRDASLIRETTNLITVEDGVKFNENLMKRVNYASTFNANVLRNSDTKEPVKEEELEYLMEDVKNLSTSVSLNGITITGKVGKKKRKSFIIDPEAITSETVTLRDNKGRVFHKNKLAYELESLKEMAFSPDTSTFIDEETGQLKSNADIASEKLDYITKQFVAVVGDTPSKKDLFSISSKKNKKK